ncbi:ATPase, T2SS/T4P/T4SS family [Haloarculaceae archaeon H-GB11]|nr:ATPase, T2SS/T4P/T4SS family [Haloarculaceae archaeon H-GB11]
MQSAYLGDRGRRPHRGPGRVRSRARPGPAVATAHRPQHARLGRRPLLSSPGGALGVRPGPAARQRPLRSRPPRRPRLLRPPRLRGLRPAHDPDSRRRARGHRGQSRRRAREGRPRTDVGDVERVPTNLVFESEREFVNVVKQLAAADGTELNASTPSAKVNLSPPGIEETIRCAVALPTISEDGPHISIRKQATDVLTPIDLVQGGSLPTELVALLWLCYEAHGVVLFSGPTGVGKTTLMNAHMPFIPFEDRPISIDEGSREVRLPTRRVSR